MKLLFNIVLIFFFLIIFVPIFRRFLFHLLVGRQILKEQKKANESFRKQSRNGNLNVDITPNRNSSHSKGGEYIDYEEIKDQ